MKSMKCKITVSTVYMYKCVNKKAALSVIIPRKVLPY